MIISSFTAGFGNQMFVYAITRAVAEKNGYEWGFNPIPEYDNAGYNGVPQFSFMNIDYGKQHEYRRDEMPPFIDCIWIEGSQEITFPDGELFRYFYYQSDVFNIPDNTKLYVANCQNALYFEDIKNDVREWFRIKQENIDRYQQMLVELGIVLDDNFCAIHVERNRLFR